MQHLAPIGTSAGKNQQRVLLTVWLSLLIQWTSGQGAAGDVIASVGDTVILTAPASDNIFRTVSWYRGNSVTESKRIISYSVLTGLQTIGGAHTGRETGQYSGSLRIRQVQTTDTGDYTVRVESQSFGLPVAPAFNAMRQLRVYDWKSLKVTTTVPWETVYEASAPRIFLLPIFIASSVAVLFATALIVAVVLYCKGRTSLQRVRKGRTTFQNAESADNLEGQHEDRNGQLAPPAAPPTGVEPHYMELKHGDQAVYDQLKSV